MARRDHHPLIPEPGRLQRTLEQIAEQHPPEQVDHPPHYGGGDDPYEAIKVIEAWSLGFCLGNAVKYIARAGRKNPELHLQDLRKARWYLDREIAKLEDPNG